MSSYLLFGFDTYYPQGGMNDFIGAYDTEEDAHTAATADHHRNFNMRHPDGTVTWMKKLNSGWTAEQHQEMYASTAGKWYPG